MQEQLEREYWQSDWALALFSGMFPAYKTAMTWSREKMIEQAALCRKHAKTNLKLANRNWGIKYSSWIGEHTKWYLFWKLRWAQLEAYLASGVWIHPNRNKGDTPADFYTRCMYLIAM